MRFPVGGSPLPVLRDQVYTFDNRLVGSVATVGVDLFEVRTREGRIRLPITLVSHRQGRRVTLSCVEGSLHEYVSTATSRGASRLIPDYHSQIP